MERKFRKFVEYSCKVAKGLFDSGDFGENRIFGENDEFAKIRQSRIKKSKEMAKGSFKIDENSTNGKLLPRFANVPMRGQIVPQSQIT